jgi:hypothetical protein
MGTGGIRVDDIGIDGIVLKLMRREKNKGIKQGDKMMGA